MHDSCMRKHATRVMKKGMVSSMEIIIRHEQELDYRNVEELTREAFWNRYIPGCDEHYLVHSMRSMPAFLPDLDFVAEYHGNVIGNIMYTKATIFGDDGRQYPVLTFGPISVLPEYQGRGIGSKLIQHTKAIAKSLGYQAILIYGDPEFYKRVGFVAAETYSIGTQWDTYAIPLLACELTPGSLQHSAGRFFEDDLYQIDQDVAMQFDQSFPPKEKVSNLPTQARFSELVAMNRPRK